MENTKIPAKSLRNQPKFKMRKLARSNLHSADTLRCPITASHEHNANEQAAQSCLGSPEINSLYFATRKQLRCFYPQAHQAMGTAVFM